MPTLTEGKLRTFTMGILELLGTPVGFAQIVCNSLVGANLVGHDSHGVLRLTSYAHLVEEGRIVPAAAPVVASRAGSVARVDGNWGWGPVGARLAAETAIALATDYGIAAVTVDRCAHIGRIGEYVAMLADAGMVGMALCNHYPAVAPYGGRERIFGTNPLALATPGGPEGTPILVDFATSGVAEGKLRVARAKGETVAPGLIVDSDGYPSQLPADFYAGGALLPFGGHKGYGLGLMVEILGGLLSGAGISLLPGFDGANGTLLVAIDISHFLPDDTFDSQASSLAQYINNSQPAQGFERVLVPGEPERIAYAHRKANGIPIPESTWLELEELQNSLAGGETL